jgi:hypothetical protein
MRARIIVAAAVALGLLGLSACSGGKDPAKAPTPSSTAVVTPTPTTSSSPATASPQSTASAAIRTGLTKAVLTTKEVKLVHQKVKASVATGVAVPTNNVCGDKKIDPSDKARVDRVQSWWLSKGWTSRNPNKAQISVTSEVVAYRPGGVAAALKAYRAAPKKCAKTKFTDGSKGTVKKAAVPAGLPAGSVVLSRVITYPTDVSTTGYIIAIPAKNVMGMLYVDGVASDPKSVKSTRARLLAAYVKQVVAAGASIGTQTATAAARA